MGRCNGGGGARHGGGGYQDGQAKGTKAGKRGHGKSGQHDATASTREVQKRDKFGKPLNHGPYQNGYHVGGSKQAAQGVNVQADNVAELGALLGPHPHPRLSPHPNPNPHPNPSPHPHPNPSPHPNPNPAPDQASVKLNASLYLPHISLRLPTSPYISLTLTRRVSS